MANPHQIKLEPHPNGKEVRVCCLKCGHNAMFAGGDVSQAEIDKWLGMECSVSDEDADKAAAERAANPKPPIVLKG